MKIVLAIVVGLAMAGCRYDERSYTMNGARTYAGAGERCKSDKRWVECDGARTPAEAAGGSGGGE